MKKTYIISGLVCIIVGMVLMVVLIVSGGPGSMMGGMMGDIDRHFIEQMIPHHEDAVVMSELALGKAEHPELKQLAETIKRDQSREIEQMRAWYKSWYGVDVPDNAASSGGGVMGMMGMGMMDDGTDLEILKAAQPFDREFIRQMVPHHQMALMMAQMVLGGSDRPEIQDLARSILKTQRAEIEQMRDFYRSWYGE